MDVSHLVFIQLSSYYCTTLEHQLFSFLEQIHPPPLWWDYLRGSDKTSWVSCQWSVHILSPAIARFLTVISLAALVFTHAFPVKESEIHQCTHAESVTKCNTVTSYWRAKLNPLRAALSSARLMCWASLVGHSQHTSSMTVPFVSNAPLVATELASTQTVISLPSIRQFPPTGPASHTLVKVSAKREAFLILSSQPFVTAVARHLINATAIQSHPHTGKWPTSFPQRENTRWRVNPSGISGIWLPRSHRRVPSKNFGLVSQSHQILGNQTIVQKTLLYARHKN